MHAEVSNSSHSERYEPFTQNAGSHHIALTLEAFVAHLKRTGKVCPKPWCWRRFWILFNPGYEPPWLSSWWMMPTQEKKDLFLRQMDYLAYHTNRFQEAYQFLCQIDEDHWLFEFEVV